MKTLLISVFAVLGLSGCIEYVEVPVKLPIFDRPVCEEVNKVKFGETIVLGYDHGLDLSDPLLHKFTLIILPITMKRLDYDTIYIYRKEDVVALIRCDRKKDGLIEAYEQVHIENNKRTKP